MEGYFIKREHWSSRSAFIFAAIGSAVGIGNAWRFPGQVYSNGGGAYLIPYLIFVAILGIPLLIMEISFGKKMQLSAPLALGRIHKRLEWLGWFATIASFVIVTYYAVVVSWVFNYMYHSFTMAWSGDSANFFTNNVLNLSASPGELGGFSFPAVIGLVLTWLCVVFVLRKGIKTMSKVVKWTVILPVFFLVVMLIVGLSLPGSSQGISYYINPDWSALGDVNVWMNALTQVLYSLSILFAIMIVYGSFLPQKANVTRDAIVIGISDALISLLAGFVVFSILGYLSASTGTPISEMDYKGVFLVFVTYPQALAMIPGGPVLQAISSLLFFVTLFLLAIDSIFSIVEATSSAIADKFRIKPKKAMFLCCIASFAVGLLYTTKAGLYWLDIVDYFVNGFNLLIIGIFETIAIGWMFGARKLRLYINETCTFKVGKFWDIVIRYIAPMIFLFLAFSFLIVNISTRYENYESQYLLIGGWAMVIVTLIASLLLQRFQSKKPQLIQENFSQEYEH